MKRATLFLALIALILVTGIVLAGTTQTPAIDWWVIGGGGDHLEQGIYTLDNTIGQPVVGVVSNGNYELCAGFWCGTAPGEYEIYLPVLLRNFS